MMKKILVLFLVTPGIALGQNVSVPAASETNSAKSVDATESFGSACPLSDAALRAGPLNANRIAFDIKSEFTYTVTTTGELTDITLLHPSSFGTDAVALQCVRQWRIDPKNVDAATTVGPHRGELVWTVPPSVPGESGDILLGRFQPGPNTCEFSYPPIAIRLNLQGTTVLQFRVTKEGGVMGATVAQSSGSIYLDDIAVSCAKFLHLQPQMSGGKPIEADRQFSVRWSIPPLGK